MLKKTLGALVFLVATAAQASPLSDYLDRLDAVECREAASQYVAQLSSEALAIAPASFWLEEYLYKGEAWTSERLYYCQLAQMRVSRETAFKSLPLTGNGRATPYAGLGSMEGFVAWANTQQNDAARKGELNAAFRYAMVKLGALHGRTGDAFLPSAVENARQAAIKAGLKNPATDEAGLLRLVATVVKTRQALVETMPEPFTPLHTVYLGASK